MASVPTCVLFRELCRQAGSAVLGSNPDKGGGEEKQAAPSKKGEDPRESALAKRPAEAERRLPPFPTTRNPAVLCFRRLQRQSRAGGGSACRRIPALSARWLAGN